MSAFLGWAGQPLTLTHCVPDPEDVVVPMLVEYVRFIQQNHFSDSINTAKPSGEE